MKIIGFTGQMGAGKSTATYILHKHYNHSTHIVKFAKPLYEMQEAIYEIISPVHTRPRGFIKDRRLLQFLGTEWGRGTISDSIWLDMWKAEVAKIKEHSINPSPVIADDVRFDNEAEVIRSLGGIVINIVSSKRDVRIDTKAGVSGHASESGISSKLISYTIENNGSLEEFKQALLSIVGSTDSSNNTKREE